MGQPYELLRAEERIETRVTALLVGRDDKLGVETGLTENVSFHGARVITKSEWPLDTTVLLALPGFHFTSGARVAYCDPIGDGRFGIGLQFAGLSEPLELAALAVALDLRLSSALSY
jgi:hypothetical protein